MKKSISSLTEKELEQLLKNIDEELSIIKQRIKFILVFISFVFLIGILISIWVNFVLGLKISMSSLVAAGIIYAINCLFEAIYKNKEDLIIEMKMYDKDRKFRNS